MRYDGGLVTGEHYHDSWQEMNIRLLMVYSHMFYVGTHWVSLLR